MKSFLIEQTPETAERAAPVMRSARLRGVRLVSAKAQGENLLGPLSLEPPLDLRIDSPKSRHMLRDGVLRVDIQFGCRAVDQSEAEFFRVECRYLVEYGLQTYAPTQEELDAFVPGNPVFNCWPYFREFVHSTSMRMSFDGVPPVPLLRVFVKPQDQIESAAPSPASSSEPARKRGPAKKRATRRSKKSK